MFCEYLHSLITYIFVRVWVVYILGLHTPFIGVDEMKRKFISKFMCILPSKYIYVNAVGEMIVILSFGCLGSRNVRIRRLHFVRCQKGTTSIKC